MPHPLPAPIMDFFSDYLARPDKTARRKFCCTLLGLEHVRAQWSLMLHTSGFDPSNAYRADIDRTGRFLDRAFYELQDERG